MVRAVVVTSVSNGKFVASTQLTGAMERLASTLNLRLCSTAAADCGDSRPGYTRRTRRLQQQCVLEREGIEAANGNSLDWIGVCCEAALMIEDDDGFDDNGHCGGEANG